MQHYQYQLQLNDENDRISGEANITIRFVQPANEFALDLVQQKANGKGMKVQEVSGDNILRYQQKDNKLVITLKKATAINEVQSFKIIYSGIPADGLIISKNKFGDRTFFADNWPNRAHNWIPCNDIPADKASVEFMVTAPAHYQIISNGIQIEETNIDKATKRTHWKEAIPLPTKVMVIGAAPFAVGRLDSASCLPITAWVYPQNQQKGFYDYALANRILSFFTEYIAPFPFQKLANVQSTTIFGGMENASAIFYTESSVTGNRKSEDLLAHEIAHQWFGDMATEKNFAHLWLSEGFATYMTDIYIKHQYGRDSMVKRLQKERQQIIDFSKKNRRAVVDSTMDLMSLLNANSYQKGSWILHMLRNEVGDSVFQKIIQTYYQQYKGSNADTRDFQKVAEAISGKDLQTFFDQWLYQPGIPQVAVSWQKTDRGISLVIQQTTDTPYTFTLPIAVTLESGQQIIKQFAIKDLLTIVRLSLNEKPVKVALDPNTNLLFSGSISEGKE